MPAFPFFHDGKEVAYTNYDEMVSTTKQYFEDGISNIYEAIFIFYGILISEYLIFNIFNLGSKKQIELYSRGIVNIDDIPDDFDMTGNQARSVENYKSKLIYKTFYNILS